MNLPSVNLPIVNPPVKLSAYLNWRGFNEVDQGQRQDAGTPAAPQAGHTA